MSSTKDEIESLTRQLYSTGRALSIPKDRERDKLHSALAESETRAYDDAQAVMFSILPDNANFTPDDAADWELRLGMITNPLVPLQDRMDAIARKMNHPGDIPARQSWDYVQQSLQAAGFDVYVHENLSELSIVQVLALNASFAQWGQQQFGNFQFSNVFSFYSSLFTAVQFGNYQFGQFGWGEQSYYNQKVVNHVDPLLDVYFNVGQNLRSTFFIGGAVLGEFANVDTAREAELRQLILKLKPVQGVAYLLINYI